MDSNESYTITAIPTSPTRSQTSKFASLRLLALKSDPSSFSSTYERESAFTQEQWAARLSTPDRITLVVSNSTDAEWVGTASVLVPSAMTFEPLQSLREVGVGDNIYVLVGMWVSTNHRRKGLGRSLVRATLEHVRDHAEAKGIGGASLALQVSSENTSGRSLYIEMGFQPIADVKDQDEWLVISAV